MADRASRRRRTGWKELFVAGQTLRNPTLTEVEAGRVAAAEEAMLVGPENELSSESRRRPSRTELVV